MRLPLYWVGCVVVAMAFPIACAVSGIAPAATSSPRRRSPANWSDYGGGPESMQYSALRQIHTGNVVRLEPAWSFDAPNLIPRTAYNPVVVDGVMYALGKDQAIVAVDAATGSLLWSRRVDGEPTCRGINYWESADGKDRRLLFASDSNLQAIDARTGRTIPSFGVQGCVDLRDGMTRLNLRGGIQSNTPGRIFENLILMGAGPGEEYNAPPGDIRAYDVVTGKLAWTFHTIPHPGEFGYDTWPPDAWKRNGGANVWGEISVDSKRGIAYFPTGSPTYDFYGANRKGQNLFGNCVLALDARTGKRRWHFQTVHHDLWDFDLSPAPKLLTVTHGGRRIDVVAQATKSGFLYVLDRETGEPIWPIEEKPVPQSDVAGEHSWPTQPFPSKPPPFARHNFSVADLNPHIDAADKKRFTEMLEKSRNEGVFTPPSRRGTIQVPGQYGGANFGCCAGDPETGMVYVKTVDLPCYNRLRFTRRPEWPTDPKSPERRGFELFRKSCVSCHSWNAPLKSIKEIGEDRFREVVRDGQGQMPGFPSLTREDVDGIMAFLNLATILRRPEDEDENAVPPPSEDGEVRFFGMFGNAITSRQGLPILSPPWAEIVAYDLNEGTIRWRKPLGTMTDLAAKGIKDTGGRASRNGPVVTAGGLLFAGSMSDNTVRAWDKATGDIVWEKALPGPPSGIPTVYEAQGRQFIVFYVGAGRPPRPDARPDEGSPPGYHAFALPK
jgi:quinoprotein glucose dehydrogenase